jgi:hypothetical protein
MYPLQEQFKIDALAKLNSQVLQAGQIAGNLLEISRQIGVLNVRTSKASAEAMTGAMQKLLAASSPVEFIQLATTVMRPVPQVWTDYAEQLRNIAGKIVAPATQGLTEAVTAAPAAPDTPAPAEAPAPLDLQGVVPPATMEAAVQEPPLPVEALVPAEPEADVPAQPSEAVAAPSQADAEPALPKAVQEVTEAINNVAKSAPVISAAATPDAKTLAKAAVVPKAAVKAGRPQAMQKGAPSGKSGSRSRKS